MDSSANVSVIGGSRCTSTQTCTCIALFLFCARTTVHATVSVDVHSVYFVSLVILVHIIYYYQLSACMCLLSNYLYVPTCI